MEAFTTLHSVHYTALQGVNPTNTFPSPGRGRISSTLTHYGALKTQSWVGVKDNHQVKAFWYSRQLSLVLSCYHSFIPAYQVVVYG